MYHIQDRDDYHKYNKICGSLRSLIHRLSLLPADDPFRQQKEAEMLNKLYDMGVLGELAGRDGMGFRALIVDVGSKPSDVENKVTVSSLARRRLAVVVARLKMSETVSDVSGPVRHLSWILISGCEDDRAGTHPSRNSTRHGPSYAHHTTSRGLCHMGGYFSKEEDHHEV